MITQADKDSEGFEALLKKLLKYEWTHLKPMREEAERLASLVHNHKPKQSEHSEQTQLAKEQQEICKAETLLVTNDLTSQARNDTEHLDRKRKEQERLDQEQLEKERQQNIWKKEAAHLKQDLKNKRQIEQERLERELREQEQKATQPSQQQTTTTPSTSDGCCMLTGVYMIVALFAFTKIGILLLHTVLLCLSHR